MLTFPFDVFQDTFFVCNPFRLVSGATPADLLAVSMATKPFVTYIPM